MREKLQGVSQGLTGVAADGLGAVGGGVKGVVDTAGNTVSHNPLLWGDVIDSSCSGYVEAVCLDRC